ncbi:hypothetical protein CHELA40_14285 [Chelatococcus asaccharovorans]|nr:hypothetical protein CHELA40_14285 [Chelatococcus asaccharovorans]
MGTQLNEIDHVSISQLAVCSVDVIVMADVNELKFVGA